MNFLEHFPWLTLGSIVIKISIVYWLMLLGLKWVGRRAIGQMGPHEFILLAILAKIMSDEIITPEAGLWGNIVGGLTLLLYVWLIDKISLLRDFIQGKPIQLLSKNGLDHSALKRNNVSKEDLNCIARQYGFKSYEVFDQIYLERDGKLTGILKPNIRYIHKK